jgi:hypothetical protein
MRLSLALLLAAAALAGCSTKYDLSGAEWKKPGTLIQTVTLDEMECVRAAREGGYTPELWVGGLVDVARYFIEERQREGAFMSCMLAKGYQPAGSGS